MSLGIYWVLLVKNTEYQEKNLVFRVMNNLQQDEY